MYLYLRINKNESEFLKQTIMNEHIALKQDINTFLTINFGQHSFKFRNEIQISF